MGCGASADGATDEGARPTPGGLRGQSRLPSSLPRLTPLVASPAERSEPNPLHLSPPRSIESDLPIPPPVSPLVLRVPPGSTTSTAAPSSPRESGSAATTPRMGSPRMRPAAAPPPMSHAVLTDPYIAVHHSVSTGELVFRAVPGLRSVRSIGVMTDPVHISAPQADASTFYTDGRFSNSPQGLEFRPPNAVAPGSVIGAESSIQGAGGSAGGGSIGSRVPRPPTRGGSSSPSSSNAQPLVSLTMIPAGMANVVPPSTRTGSARASPIKGNRPPSLIALRGSSSTNSGGGITTPMSEGRGGPNVLSIPGQSTTSSSLLTPMASDMRGASVTSVRGQLPGGELSSWSAMMGSRSRQSVSATYNAGGVAEGSGQPPRMAVSGNSSSTSLQTADRPSRSASPSTLPPGTRPAEDDSTVD